MKSPALRTRVYRPTYLQAVKTVLLAVSLFMGVNAANAGWTIGGTGSAVTPSVYDSDYSDYFQWWKNVSASGSGAITYQDCCSTTLSWGGTVNCDVGVNNFFEWGGGAVAEGHLVSAYGHVSSDAYAYYTGDPNDFTDWVQVHMEAAITGYVDLVGVAMYDEFETDIIWITGGTTAGVSWNTGIPGASGGSGSIAWDGGSGGAVANSNNSSVTVTNHISVGFNSGIATEWPDTWTYYNWFAEFSFSISYDEWYELPTYSEMELMLGATLSANATANAELFANYCDWETAIVGASAQSGISGNFDYTVSVEF